MAATGGIQFDSSQYQQPQELVMAVEPTFSAGRLQAISQAYVSSGLGFWELSNLRHAELVEKYRESLELVKVLERCGCTPTTAIDPPQGASQGDALPAVRPPTGQVATETVLERNAHLSLQPAKAQARSCEQCIWRPPRSDELRKGITSEWAFANIKGLIKGCYQCMGIWYNRRRSSKFNKLQIANRQIKLLKRELATSVRLNACYKETARANLKRAMEFSDEALHMRNMKVIYGKLNGDHCCIQAGYRDGEFSIRAAACHEDDHEPVSEEYPSGYLPRGVSRDEELRLPNMWHRLYTVLSEQKKIPRNEIPKSRAEVFDIPC